MYGWCRRRCHFCDVADAAPPSRAYSSSSGMSGMYSCVSVCPVALNVTMVTCAAHHFALENHSAPENLLLFFSFLFFFLFVFHCLFFFFSMEILCVMHFCCLEKALTALSFEIQTDFEDCQNWQGKTERSQKLMPWVKTKRRESWIEKKGSFNCWCAT